MLQKYEIRNKFTIMILIFVPCLMILSWGISSDVLFAFLTNQQLEGESSLFDGMSSYTEFLLTYPFKTYVDGATQIIQFALPLLLPLAVGVFLDWKLDFFQMLV